MVDPITVPMIVGPHSLLLVDAKLAHEAGIAFYRERARLAGLRTDSSCGHLFLGTPSCLFLT